MVGPRKKRWKKFVIYKWINYFLKINSAGAPSNEKSFLYHCYPDGIGPDSELIQLLEKDVVELNPNITFEDIAELDKAKEILQEAVLLPIMIPNFFKVKEKF